MFSKRPATFYQPIHLFGSRKDEFYSTIQERVNAGEFSPNVISIKMPLSGTKTTQLYFLVTSASKPINYNQNSVWKVFCPKDETELEELLKNIDRECKESFIIKSPKTQIKPSQSPFPIIDTELFSVEDERIVHLLFSRMAKAYLIVNNQLDPESKEITKESALSKSKSSVPAFLSDLKTVAEREKDREADTWLYAQPSPDERRKRIR